MPRALLLFCVLPFFFSQIFGVDKADRLIWRLVCLQFDNSMYMSTAARRAEKVDQHSKVPTVARGESDWYYNVILVTRLRRLDP